MIANGVTWEQFRESILAGWTNCIPGEHLDAVAAWKHLLAGGKRADPDDGYDAERQIWDSYLDEQ